MVLVMGNVIAIVIIIVLMALAMYVIPRFLISRAVNKVVRIFRNNSAIDIKHAKTAEELGLRHSGGMFRMRDYKPLAIQVLMGADIIRSTEGNRLYLSEDKLAASKFGKPSNQSLTGR